MEKWIIDKIHLDLTGKLKILINNEIPLKTNIPLFHRSIIPCPPASPESRKTGRWRAGVRQKDQASKNYYNFSKLYNFRDV